MSEHQLRMALGPAARAIGGAVLCAITLAACGERGRGARPDGGANAGAAPAESVGAAAQATPRASGDSTRAGAPETTTSAGAGAAAESAG
ncbi:MAG TPA: hypothetical protein VFK09_05870, partial [Gemmatimonadales bacterium]|nr:hypothetical protein [Gemmatimonadales bacterium]